MRRDQFTVAVQHDGDDLPALEIAFDGSAAELDERLATDGEQLEETELDAAYRLVEASDEEDGAGEETDGVFSLTHRVTGAYLLEVNGAIDEITHLVSAARETDDEPCYRVRISPEEGEERTFELSALFVYDSEGDLLRQRSLIPSGVEL